MQGDIVAIYNESGAKVASYVYDAWGNFITTYHNGGASLTPVIKNPLLYRGYYYDRDLGMYYLQTRYYDSNIGRFLNADSYVSTGQGMLGHNMYAYCDNNPVMYVDPTGEFPWLVVGIMVLTTIIGGILGAQADTTSQVNNNPTLTPTPENSITEPEKQESGNNVVANVMVGAAIGLAAGGAVVSTIGVVASVTIGSTTKTITLFALSGAQLFALGALAYNVFPMLLAPFIGVEAETLEYPTP